MREFMATNINNTREELASSENNTKKRKKQKTKTKAIEENGGQARIQKDDRLDTSEKTSPSEVAHVDSEINILQTSLNEQPLANLLKLDSGSTEILTDGNTNGKKRKRTRKIKVPVTDDVLGTDINVQALAKHSEMDSGSAEYFSDENKASKKKGKKKKKAEVEEQNIKDDIHNTDQTMTDTGSINYISESETKKIKVPVTDDVLGTDINVQAIAKHSEMDSGSAEYLPDENKASKKKRKKKKKAEVEEQNIKDDIHSTDQTMTDTGSINYISESETKKMKAHVTDEILSTDINVQSLAKHSEMDSGSAENLSDGIKASKKKRKKKKKAEVEEQSIKDDTQSTDQTMTDTGSIIYNSESKNNFLETDLNVEPLAKKFEIDSGQVEILSHVNKVSKKKKKKKNKAEVEDENQSMYRAKVMDRGSIEVKDEIHITDQIMTDARSTIYISEPENNILEATLDVQPVSKHSIIPGSMENPSEGNKVSKKKSKKKKKAHSEEENQSMNVTKIDTGSTECQKLAKIEEEIHIVDQASAILNLHVLGEIDGCNGSIENLDQVNVKSKNKKKKNKNKVENKDDVHIVDQVGAMSNLPTVNLVKENLVQKVAKVKDEVLSMVQPKVMDRGSIEVKDENQSTDQIVIDARSTIYISEPENNLLEATLDVQPVSKHSVIPGSMENLAEENKVSKKKNKKKKKAKAEEENQSMNVTKMDTGSTKCQKLAKIEEEIHIVDNAILNLHVLGEIDGCNGSIENLDQVNLKSKKNKNKNKNKVENKDDVHIVDQVGAMSNLLTVNLVEGNLVQKMAKVKDEVQSMVQPNLTLHTDLSTESHKQGIDDKVTENQYTAQLPRLAVTAPVRRKLLVLDINGLLADIVMPAPKYCRADTQILGRAIFRRPFYKDFLEFCFQNFDVGIWSSRAWRVIDKVVGYLLNGQRNKLLFVWDMSCCTKTGFKTLDNKHKPMVCKGLQQIWDADYPNLPWKKGDYDETNTLLLDDSPYKALLNPLHTAVFPRSYTYQMKKDTSLGPGGDLRVYLEGLITCDNVQKYVEQHPFGEAAIGETHPSWGFYSEVLRALT